VHWRVLLAIPLKGMGLDYFLFRRLASLSATVGSLIGKLEILCRAKI
jgi:hypothetical protein